VLYHPDGGEKSVDASECATIDGMRDAGGGLFECLSESGFLLVSPTIRPETAGTFVCRIVYRPVVPRS
jgi:hypothetical protein